MPSTYSTNLRLELMATGENRTTWGSKANTDFNLIEDAIAGSSPIDMANADHTLISANGSADEARNAILMIGGTNTAIRTLTIPAVSKIYIMYNGTSGGFAVTVSNGTNTTSLTNGKWYIVWTDGTLVFSTPDFSTFALASQLADLSGVTNQATARSNLGLGTIATQASSAVTITGGSITGITDLAIADGGTGASDAASARVALGAQPLDATLTALAAFNSNGSLTQTAADTFVARSIAGTANEITATNGDGVAGNPTLSLPSALTFTGKTITGGTYASAALNGSLGASTPSTISGTTGTFSSTLAVTGIATFAAVVKHPDGTAAAPSFTFTNDPNTGFYSYSADSLGWSTNGVFRGNFTNTALNVGRDSIDPTTPGASLGVNGQSVSGVDGDTAWILNRLNSNGSIIQFRKDNVTVGTIAITASATAYNTSSDERLKKNFGSFDSGAMVDALAFGKFQWVRDSTNAYGVLAQATIPVFPEAVTEGDDGYYSVDYSKFVPILGAELKALRRRVAELEAKVT